MNSQNVSVWIPITKWGSNGREVGERGSERAHIEKRNKKVTQFYIPRFFLFEERMNFLWMLRIPASMWWKGLFGASLRCFALVRTKVNTRTEGMDWRINCLTEWTIFLRRERERDAWWRRKVCVCVLSSKIYFPLTRDRCFGFSDQINQLQEFEIHPERVGEEEEEGRLPSLSHTNSRVDYMFTLLFAILLDYTRSEEEMSKESI